MALPYGGIAQLGEHLPCKQGAVGSSPIISTKTQKELFNMLKVILAAIGGFIIGAVASLAYFIQLTK